MWYFLGGIVLLILGYFTYGKFLERILAPDDRETPAVKNADGVDFVQLPHHGWGDGGTDLDFYKLADAPYVLYPGPRYAPSKSEKWACEHAKEYFMNPGMTTTIDLPYKPQ